MKLLVVWLCLLAWVILASGQNTTDPGVINGARPTPTITNTTESVTLEKTNKVDQKTSLKTTEPSPIILNVTDSSETSLQTTEPSTELTTVQKTKIATVQPKKFITAATVVAAPWALRATKGDKLEGFVPELLDSIGNDIGVSVKVREVKDGEYGGPRQTCCLNNWSGIVGELMDEKVDIGGLLTVTSNRSKVISFSKPVINSVVYIISRRVQYDVYKTGVFFVMRPLEAGVWFLIIFAFIGIGALLYVFRMFSPKPPAGDAENQVGACKWDAREEFWFTFVALMWQGASGSPKSLASRVLIGFWLGFTLLTILLYAASLVDHLSVSWPVRKAVAPPSSLEDLLNQDKILYGAVQPSFTVNQLKTEKFRHIYETMESQGTLVSSLTEGIAKVKAGNYALFLDSLTAQNYLNNDCDLVKVGVVSILSTHAFGFPDGSPIIDMVNRALLHVREDGSLQEIYNKWFKPKDCPNDGIPEVHLPTAVTPAMFAGPIVFIILGIIVAVLIFVSEILCYKYRKQGSFTPKVDANVEEGSMLLEEDDKLAEENQAADIEAETALIDEEADTGKEEADTDKKESEEGEAKVEPKDTEEKGVSKGDDKAEKLDEKKQDEPTEKQPEETTHGADETKSEQQEKQKEEQAKGEAVKREEDVKGETTLTTDDKKPEEEQEASKETNPETTGEAKTNKRDDKVEGTDAPSGEADKPKTPTGQTEENKPKDTAEEKQEDKPKTDEHNISDEKS